MTLTVSGEDWTCNVQWLIVKNIMCWIFSILLVFGIVIWICEARDKEEQDTARKKNEEEKNQLNEFNKKNYTAVNQPECLLELDLGKGGLLSQATPIQIGQRIIDAAAIERIVFYSAKPPDIKYTDGIGEEVASTGAPPYLEICLPGKYLSETVSGEDYKPVVDWLSQYVQLPPEVC